LEVTCDSWRCVLHRTWCKRTWTGFWVLVNGVYFEFLLELSLIQSVKLVFLCGIKWAVLWPARYSVRYSTLGVWRPESAGMAKLAASGIIFITLNHNITLTGMCTLLLFKNAFIQKLQKVFVNLNHTFDVWMLLHLVSRTTSHFEDNKFLHAHKFVRF